MTDAPQAETAEVGRLHDRVWLAKLTKFERLHRDYLAARAAYADPDGPDDDEVKAPLSDKQDAAELALLVQPSPATWGIRSNRKSSTASSPPTPRMVIRSRTVSSPPSAPSRPTSSGSG